MLKAYSFLKTLDFVYDRLFAMPEIRIHLLALNYYLSSFVKIGLKLFHLLLTKNRGFPKKNHQVICIQSAILYVCFAINMLIVGPIVFIYFTMKYEYIYICLYIQIINNSNLVNTHST